MVSQNPRDLVTVELYPKRHESKSSDSGQDRGQAKIDYAVFASQEWYY